MAESSFHDHFSPPAAGYARYRPRYPEALFDFLAGLCREHTLAWDCGTGNGQAAVALTRHFAHVVATDASAAQIAHAQPHARIAYHVAPASASPLAEATADLVTVAQALHWFPFEAFYAEARRVLKPGGVLAVWAYGFQQNVGGGVDEILRRFYQEIVGPYWPPERRYIDEGYRTIPFPFPEIEPPAFFLAHRWTLAEQLGYLRTWSATRRYREANGDDPVARIEPALTAAWGDPEVPREIRWPVFLRVARPAEAPGIFPPGRR